MPSRIFTQLVPPLPRQDVLIGCSFMFGSFLNSPYLAPNTYFGSRQPLRRIFPNRSPCEARRWRNSDCPGQPKSIQPRISVPMSLQIKCGSSGLDALANFWRDRVSPDNSWIDMNDEIYFALSQRTHRIRYPLRRAINLNPLQRLNQPHPEHSFLSLAAWRPTPASAAAD